METAVIGPGALARQRKMLSVRVAAGTCEGIRISNPRQWKFLGYCERGVLTSEIAS